MVRVEKAHQEIVDYWFSIVKESELSVDASEAIERCCDVVMKRS